MGDRKDAMAHLDADLLKPTDVADRLGVSRSWVYDAAKSGRIPCLRLGGPDGPLRFLRSDVEAWLDRARLDWMPGTSNRRVTLQAAHARTAESSAVRFDERSSAALRS
jgi:excisionase family DNA binding protein